MSRDKLTPAERTPREFLYCGQCGEYSDLRPDVPGRIAAGVPLVELVRCLDCGFGWAVELDIDSPSGRDFRLAVPKR